MNVKEQDYINGDIRIHYYEIGETGMPLVLIHAQGIDARSYNVCWNKLAEVYHVFAVDCNGHGQSSHDAKRYTLSQCSRDITEFIHERVGETYCLSGHSSGGLISAYIAAHGKGCRKVFFEDPPFFSCQGERRFTAYNYLDLSTVCHQYLQEANKDDFIAYYFRHQKAWDFFPEKSREKIRKKMCTAADKYRAKHPDKPLKIMFWPKASLKAFDGMENYDPRFGEAFYNDTFNGTDDHGEILRKVKCPAILMKAKTNFSDDGTLLAAMSEDDAKKAIELMKDATMTRFETGHGIHTEDPSGFVGCLIKGKPE